jgi:integrase/recombinase XerD
MEAKPIVIRLRLIEHDGVERMFAEFPFNKKVAAAVKAIPGAKWSQRKKMWHLNPTNQVYLLLKEKVKGLAEIDSSELKRKQIPSLEGMESVRNTQPSTRHTGLKPMPTEEQRKALAWYRKWMLSCGYAQNTINTYSSLLEMFFLFVKDKKVRDVTENDVINFNSDFIVKTKRSSSYQRQCINAIKLFYEQIPGSRLRTDKLQRVKRAKMLPGVLSLDEIKTLLNSYDNLKHKALIMVTYACGLRRSEVLNLKWKDIDRKRMILTVRLGKGAKDRQVVLPEKILKMLEEYFRKYKTKEYVFEGQYGGQYTAASFAEVLKQGLKRTGIRKDISLHNLRHSYATHLHEQGTDIAILQQLLGHQSIKTTLIYTHISKKTLHGVKNPIDNMDI